MAGNGVDVRGTGDAFRGRFFGLAGVLTCGDGDQDRPCGPARTGRCARRLKKPTLKRTGDGGRGRRGAGLRMLTGV